MPLSIIDLIQERILNTIGRAKPRLEARLACCRRCETSPGKRPATCPFRTDAEYVVGLLSDSAGCEPWRISP